MIARRTVSSPWRPRWGEFPADHCAGINSTDVLKQLGILGGVDLGELIALEGWHIVESRGPQLNEVVRGRGLPASYISLGKLQEEGIT